MANTNWTIRDGVYNSRDGRIKIYKIDNGRPVRDWGVEVDGEYIGWQRRLDNAKQLGVEKRDGFSGD